MTYEECAWYVLMEQASLWAQIWHETRYGPGNVEGEELHVKFWIETQPHLAAVQVANAQSSSAKITPPVLGPPRFASLFLRR